MRRKKVLEWVPQNAFKFRKVKPQSSTASN